MTALLLIVAALLGALGWAGRSRRRVTYYDQYISDDVDAYGGDICCDDSCTSDNYQDNASAAGERDD